MKNEFLISLLIFIFQFFFEKIRKKNEVRGIFIFIFYFLNR